MPLTKTPMKIFCVRHCGQLLRVWSLSSWQLNSSTTSSHANLQPVAVHLLDLFIADFLSKTSKTNDSKRKFCPAHVLNFPIPVMLTLLILSYVFLSKTRRSSIFITLIVIFKSPANI